MKTMKSTKPVFTPQNYINHKETKPHSIRKPSPEIDRTRTKNTKLCPRPPANVEDSLNFQNIYSEAKKQSKDLQSCKFLDFQRLYRGRSQTNKRNPILKPTNPLLQVDVKSEKNNPNTSIEVQSAGSALQFQKEETLEGVPRNLTEKTGKATMKNDIEIFALKPTKKKLLSILHKGAAKEITNEEKLQSGRSKTSLGRKFENPHNQKAKTTDQRVKKIDAKGIFVSRQTPTPKGVNRDHSIKSTNYSNKNQSTSLVTEQLKNMKDSSKMSSLVKIPSYEDTLNGRLSIGREREGKSTNKNQKPAKTDQNKNSNTKQNQPKTHQIQQPSNSQIKFNTEYHSKLYNNDHNNFSNAARIFHSSTGKDKLQELTTRLGEFGERASLRSKTMQTHNRSKSEIKEVNNSNEGIDLGTEPIEAPICKFSSIYKHLEDFPKFDEKTDRNPRGNSGPKKKQGSENMQWTTWDELSVQLTKGNEDSRKTKNGNSLATSKQKQEEFSTFLAGDCLSRNDAYKAAKGLNQEKSLPINMEVDSTFGKEIHRNARSNMKERYSAKSMKPKKENSAIFNSSDNYESRLYKATGTPIQNPSQAQKGTNLFGTDYKKNFERLLEASGATLKKKINSTTAESLKEKMSSFTKKAPSKHSHLYYLSELYNSYISSLKKDQEKKQEPDKIIEHYSQNILGYLKIIESAKLSSEKSVPSIRLNLPLKRDPGKKMTIIFDLDETLIHSKPENSKTDEYPPSPATTDCKESKLISGYSVVFRPFIKELMLHTKKRFEIGIFTSAEEEYANSILDEIDPRKELFDFRLYRQHCIEVIPGIWVKDLGIINNRDEETLFIVDNNLYCSCLNLPNSIPILPFLGDQKDQELLKLKDYLSKIDMKHVNLATSTNKRYFGFDLIETYKNDLKSLPQKMLARIEALSPLYKSVGR